MTFCIEKDKRETQKNTFFHNFLFIMDSVLAKNSNPWNCFSVKVTKIQFNIFNCKDKVERNPLSSSFSLHTHICCIFIRKQNLFDLLFTQIWHAHCCWLINRCILHNVHTHTQFILHIININIFFHRDFEGFKLI